MDLHAGEVAGVRVKGHFDLTLEHFAQATADSMLFSRGQGRGGGHGDLLNAFRRIGKFREGFGDFRKKADAILLAVPIYNYDVNSAAKNLVEMTGDAWNEKVVGFVCTAGGHGGFMSVMPFANSLMLDFRCVIIPRFVYSPRTAIDDTSFGDAAIHKRVEELTVELERVTEALFPSTG